MLGRAVFSLYPPFLHRFAVMGRDILEHVEALGFPMPLIWQNLARTVPPKTLNTNAGMLEVLPDTDDSYDPERPFRIAAIAHVTDVGGVHELHRAPRPPSRRVRPLPHDDRRAARDEAAPDTGTRTATRGCKPSTCG